MAETATPSEPIAQPPSLFAQAFGMAALVLGIGLIGLTLAGAAAGFEAIGVYDVIIGGMYLAFGYKATRFGLDVIAGRQRPSGGAPPY